MKTLKMIALTRKPEIASEVPPASPERYAPTLYLDDVDGLENFPEEGMMLVKFKRTSLSVSSGKNGTRVSMALEIPCICEVMPEKVEKEREAKAEDVLDKLLEEAAKEQSEKDED